MTLAGMADDPEPPRKRYELKPRDFERANPPATAAPTPGTAPASAPNPAERIDVRELYRQAAVPGPQLAPGAKPPAKNDVTAILQHNVAHEKAAGLNAVDPRPRPKSRRLRDYVLLMLALNGAFGAVTLNGVRSGDVMVWALGLGGMVFASAALTWVMWFIVDRY